MEFETALIQAFLFVFPGTHHRGCHFHFSEAIWWKAQELLAKAYRVDTSVVGFVRKMISLAFVPPNFVRVAWNNLKLAAPSDLEILPSILYFKDTRIMGHFDIPQWNQHENRKARTNILKKAWPR